jgi:hypothetical protein
MCILLLLGNGSVKTIPRQPLHNNRKVVGLITFYTASVVTNGIRRLVVPRTFSVAICFSINRINICVKILCFVQQGPSQFCEYRASTIASCAKGWRDNYDLILYKSLYCMWYRTCTSELYRQLSSVDLTQSVYKTPRVTFRFQCFNQITSLDTLIVIVELQLASLPYISGWKSTHQGPFHTKVRRKKTQENLARRPSWWSVISLRTIDEWYPTQAYKL